MPVIVAKLHVSSPYITQINPSTLKAGQARIKRENCHYTVKIYRFHRFCTPSLFCLCIPSSSMVHCGDTTVYTLVECAPMLGG